MTQLHVYDPSETDTIFAGIPLSGFAEDTMVTIEEDEDAFSEVAGVDGDVTRSRREGRRATVTISLMSSSQSNAVLSAIHQQDLLQPGGAGVSPILLRDGNGTSVFASDKAWILRMPSAEKGRAATAREWKIRVVNYTFFEGGST